MRWRFRLETKTDSFLRANWRRDFGRTCPGARLINATALGPPRKPI